MIIIEMTPFIFEDGKTYYFNITKRDYTNDYHDIWVYEKVEKEIKGWFKTTKKTEYIKLSEKPELISVKLDTKEIKRSIKTIIISTRASYQLKDWDGLVGDIPDDIKTAFKRDSRLDDLFK
jgi:hypothetical protein